MTSFAALCASAALAKVVGGPPTFAAPVDYDATVTGANYVVVGDVLRNRKDDLLVTHAGDNFGTVSLSRGRGDGTFGPPRTVFVGTATDEAVEAHLADVNGDGNLDLVILTASVNGGTFFTVALGDGKGQFRTTSQTPITPGRFVIAKFGHDVLPDIFLQTPDALPATIYRSDGNGAFKAPLQLPYGGGAGGLISIDINHDGLLDLVGIGEGRASVDPERLQTLFGTGDSQYFAPPRYTLPSLDELYATGNNSGLTAAAGDLRGNGNTDLIVFGGDAQPGVTGPLAGSVYLGHPDGSFDPPLLLPMRDFVLHGSAARVADFNGDGIADIFLTAYTNLGPSSSFVLRGLGDGTFPIELQSELSVVPLYPHVVVIDLNRDGRPDVIMSDATTNRGVWVLLNTTPAAGRTVDLK